MIEVKNLVYEYPGLRALDKVSFNIERGSITALVGPNGAGKTTLMRCLAGLARPLSGNIWVAGIDVIAEPRRSHRALGYLSDSFGLYASLSVRQTLRYVAAANGIEQTAIDTAVIEVSTSLGLGERLDQLVGQLSRGLHQRLAIGQAIIHGPIVVVLDEPASGLDPAARHELGELFLRLRRRGITLVISSHILAELEAYSTHMMILRAGQIVEHRALSDQLSDLATIDIETPSSRESVCALLALELQVSKIEITDNGVRFDFNGPREARAALLRRLVMAGIDVVRFAPREHDLQQSYLKSIQP